MVDRVAVTPRSRITLVSQSRFNVRFLIERRGLTSVSSSIDDETDRRYNKSGSRLYSKSILVYIIIYKNTSCNSKCIGSELNSKPLDAWMSQWRIGLMINAPELSSVGMLFNPRTCLSRIIISGCEIDIKSLILKKVYLKPYIRLIL